MSKEKQKPVGGLFFFFSLLCVLAVSILNVRFLPLVIKNYPQSRVMLFTVAVLLGAIVGRFIIQRRLSVFLHEMKHAIVSNFAGNKAKGMKVKRDSGHFTYEYTEATAHLNAFISLAPYWLPVFTTITFGLVYLSHLTTAYKILCVGLAFGADVGVGARDISPIQSDLTTIRGGFILGVSYVLANHVALATILLAWAGGGFEGVGLLVAQYFKLLLTH